MPSMNDVVLGNRQHGPEIVMQMAEDRAPDGFANVEEAHPAPRAEEVSLSFSGRRDRSADRQRAASFDVR